MDVLLPALAADPSVEFAAAAFDFLHAIVAIRRLAVNPLRDRLEKSFAKVIPLILKPILRFQNDFSAASDRYATYLLQLSLQSLPFFAHFPLNCTPALSTA
jgi:hypothetical protein